VRIDGPVCDVDVVGAQSVICPPEYSYHQRNV
jgi:hypothetical protein